MYWSQCSTRTFPPPKLFIFEMGTPLEYKDLDGMSPCRSSAIQCHHLWDISRTSLRCLRDSQEPPDHLRDIQASPMAKQPISDLKKIRTFFQTPRPRSNRHSLWAPPKPHQIYKTASYFCFNSQKQRARS